MYRNINAYACRNKKNRTPKIPDWHFAQKRIQRIPKGGRLFSALHIYKGSVDAKVNVKLRHLTPNFNLPSFSPQERLPFSWGYRYFRGTNPDHLLYIELTLKLVVLQTHKFCDWSFSATDPRLWNDLPSGLRRPDLSFPMFRQKLKTLLFDRIVAVTFRFCNFTKALYSLCRSVCMRVCTYVCVRKQPCPPMN